MNEATYFPGFRDFGKKFAVSVAYGFIGAVLTQSLVIWFCMFGIGLATLVFADLRGKGIDVDSTAGRYAKIMFPAGLFLIGLELLLVPGLHPIFRQLSGDVVAFIMSGVVILGIWLFFRPCHRGERRS